MPTFTIKPVTKTKTKEIDALLQAVVAYKHIKARISHLQEQLKEPAEVIKLAASNAPDGKIVTDDYKIILIPIVSERFDLKSAMEILGRKKLSPFLTESSYTQLRVS